MCLTCCYALHRKKEHIRSTGCHCLVYKASNTIMKHYPGIMSIIMSIIPEYALWRMAV